MIKGLKIELIGIEKKYRENVLDGISLKIESGEYISIIGKSGAGKTTLMNIIGLIENADKGIIKFNNIEINSKRSSNIRLNEIGFVYQSYNLLLNYSGKDNILLPTIYSKKKYDNMMRLAEDLDIVDLLDEKVARLSGGEKQRVAIARALILNPSLIIADEPTGNLDEINKNRVLQILRDENEKGRTIIVITHDKEVAKNAKKVYELKNGKLYEKNRILY